ncbi:MAG: hypothetical protein KHZ62_11155 [Clostridiales bacterium]|nr:hypothetical protein [Clostridiales bacterium]
MINKLKNFTIIFLICIAVFQTGRLWLDDRTGHNLFYFISSLISENKAGDIGTVKSIDPESITVSIGGKRFRRVNPDGNKNEVSKKVKSTLSQTLEHGHYQGIEEIDWDKYLSEQSVICNYSFEVSITEFARSFGTKVFLPEPDMEYFESIAICPSMKDGGKTDIYFLSWKLAKAFHYTLNDPNSTSKLISAMEEKPAFKEMEYISTKQNGFHIFKENIFVPQWPQGGLDYAVLKKINPFEYDGTVDMDSVENQVENFFSSFTSKRGDNSQDGLYMFSDESTVVKYFVDTGILEYYNYISLDENKNQTLTTAYSVCWNFLKNDKSLTTDIYLSGVEMGGEGLEFYFDYVIDGVPIRLGQELSESTQMEHALEVVVKDNSVRKYRRYAFNFQKSNVIDTVTIDFSSALSEVMQSFDQAEEITKVEDMLLAYEINSSDRAERKWFITILDTTYTTEAK